MAITETTIPNLVRYPSDIQPFIQFCKINVPKKTPTALAQSISLLDFLNVLTFQCLISKDFMEATSIEISFLNSALSILEDGEPRVRRKVFLEREVIQMGVGDTFYLDANNDKVRTFFPRHLLPPPVVPPLFGSVCSSPIRLSLAPWLQIQCTVRNMQFTEYGCRRSIYQKYFYIRTYLDI